MQVASDLYIFGIRHHGPGSAHALYRALQELSPDAILVEGPPDANEVIHWLAHPEMQPPIALIVYRPDQPRRAAIFPFAVFSPELQALRYGVERGITTHFMDLPQEHLLAVDERIELPDPEPLRLLAQASGLESYEHWWNQVFEQREDTADVFVAALEIMQSLREGTDRPLPPGTEITGRRLSAQREAHMRQSIRKARAEGNQRIAVVCGAWHTPSLIDLNQAEADTLLLAGLPSEKVESVWVPWTYSRLSNRSGYGAGIGSPGWYHHLWQARLNGAAPSDVVTQWLSQVAALLRGEGFEASPAHVISAVHLAESLAVLRDLPIPGLPELNEATQAVMCFGDTAPMRLVRERLIISERMGTVPPGVPMVPLQRDLHREQLRLRLREQPQPTTLNLDLRVSLHLERSHLLHRLKLLNIPWGKKIPARIKDGTFREVWKLQWLPEYSVRVIEANIWGNTVEDAVEAYVGDLAVKATSLAVLTKLLDDLILADLPDAISGVMQRIAEESAISSDIPMLMKALPPLVRMLRYGSVRQIDRETITSVVDGLLTRICVGLPITCTSMNDQVAQEMFQQIQEVNNAVHTLHQSAKLQQWHETLTELVDQSGLHGVVAGQACRLLLDNSIFSRSQAAERLERVVSAKTLSIQTVEEIVQIGFWLEGFFKHNALLVLHDKKLWAFVYQWISTLDEEQFLGVLPLLRRTFIGLGDSARRQIQERVKHGQIQHHSARQTVHRFDQERAAATMPLIKRLLGLEP